MTTATTIEDLWSVIEEFTNATRQQDPQGNWQLIPSLWDMLQDSTIRAGGRGSAVSRSRPPISTAVVALVQEVEKACRMELRSRRADPVLVPILGRAPGCSCRTPQKACSPGNPTEQPTIGQRHDIPAELRRINSLIRHEPEDVEEWTGMLRRWTLQATDALGLSNNLPGTLRDIPCVDCHQAWDYENVDGETVKRPTLHLKWRGTLVHYVWCSACGSSRWPADLHFIAEYAMSANLSRETMTDTQDATGGSAA